MWRPEVIVNHKPRILFFSTHDSTRSQIAEGFLRQFAGEDFVAVSTGQSPEADPLIRDVMKEVGIDVSGQQSKQIGESFKGSFLLCRQYLRRYKREISRLAIHAEHCSMESG
jgi:Low molecular weight phosphotyrosine protein phosphatase